MLQSGSCNPIPKTEGISVLGIEFSENPRMSREFSKRLRGVRGLPRPTPQETPPDPHCNRNEMPMPHSATTEILWRTCLPLTASSTMAMA